MLTLVYLALIIFAPKYSSENYEIKIPAKASIHPACTVPVSFVQLYLSYFRNGQQKLMNPLATVGITHLAARKNLQQILVKNDFALVFSLMKF